MNNATHPFAGGKKRPNVTQKHSPLVWECMLGTVYARDPVTKKVKYFDYDWDAARAYAMVDQCADLRTCKVAISYQGYPAKGKLALWGIPPLATT